MANGLFIPSFRGAGSPGSPGVGTTQQGLQAVEAGRIGLQTSRDQAALQSMVTGAQQLKQIRDPNRKMEFLQNRRVELQRAGLPTEETDEGIELIQAGDLQGLEDVTDQLISLGQEAPKPFTLGAGQSRFTGAGGLIAEGEPVPASPQEKPAGQREFEAKLTGLSEDQQNEAVLIDLGLSPRAVGSAIQTITALDLAEDIGDAEATIGQRKKFGELTGASRAKTIDKGFERIAGITKNILNIDRAISALDSGAGTGAVERFLPTIKAASQELRQIQGELALDVIGAVTFGALSQGELDLARDIALPTGLDEPELKDFLTRKKGAQQKLSDYFSEQIQFLDQGGTLAGFLRRQETASPADVNTGQVQRLVFDPATGQLVPK